MVTKGQLISKTNCQAVNSSKKQTNEFVFTGMNVFTFVFWKKLKTPKRHFEITWPLKTWSDYPTYRLRLWFRIYVIYKSWKLLLGLVTFFEIKTNIEFSFFGHNLIDIWQMLQQMQWRPNHTSYRNFHFNEFVVNALRDNIGSKN